MTSKLIVALDFPTAELALSFVKPLNPKMCKLKVGFELFVSAGPEFVKQLVDSGYDVFLDLKFHDIPNTVASACRTASALGVWMMNVHASGSDIMMRTAKQALIDCNSSAKLIAVTVLTSMDEQQLSHININSKPEDQVSKLAQLTQQSGLDGVVCSVFESRAIKEITADSFLTLCPAIRPFGEDAADQQRVATLELATQERVDFPVVGRPIYKDSDPVSKVEKILETIG